MEEDTQKQARPADVLQEEAPINKVMITVSIMLATIMQVLDTTIANVALPHMQGGLNATQEQVSWILTSYIIAAAVMTAPTGFLASYLGRKRLFVISIVGFTLASMLCGMAQNLPEMIGFRLLQGVFGAALVPLSQAILLDINPKEKHGQAMAMWGVGIMLGPIMGPMLGGYLTENFDWRWVFYINVPIGIAALIGTLTFLPETARNFTRRFDVLGFAFLSLSIAGLQLMLDRGQDQDWFSSTEIILWAALMVVSAYFYLVHTFTTDHPFLEPAMFRDRNFVVSLVFIFIIGIILLATLALLPPFLQNLMNYPVITTGMVMAPRGLGTMISMILVGRLISRIDARYFIFLGLTLTAYSLHMMTLFTPDIPTSAVISSGIVQGFGLGFVFIPLSTMAYSTLAPEYRNDAASIFSLVRNIGSSIGISIMVTLVARNTQINHSEIGGSLKPYGFSGELMHQMSRLSGTETNSQAGLALLNAEVTRQAAAISYLNDFKAMMLLTILAAPIILLLKKPRATQASGAGESAEIPH